MTRTNKVYLAPLAGVSDRAFRELAYFFGCDGATTEMVSAKGLYYRDKATAAIMDHADSRTGIQIFGSDPEIIGQVVEERINKEDFAFLDFNMGCPAPKIFNNKEGSYLMKEPGLVKDILQAMVQASNKPVHLKIRLGIDEENKNYLVIGRLAEEAGISSICLHARTRKAYYSGEADWSAIKRLKEEVGIEVIGNGDIRSGQDALKMLDYTGCDSIMIGRGAMGRPYIFEEVKAALEERPYKDPSGEEIYQIITRHYQLASKYKGPRSILEMRGHIGAYLKGMPASAQVKNKINRSKDIEEIKGLLRDYLLDG